MNMKTTKKTVALAVVIGTLGMAGSALAAPYRGTQIKHVPNLTQHAGRGHGAEKQGWSSNRTRRTEPQTWDNRGHRGQGWNSNPTKRPNPQTMGKTQGHRPQPTSSPKALDRQWQGRFRVR